MLDILAFRWPRPCYLVGADRGRVALVVTEMLASRSLARLRAFMSNSTVLPLQHAGLIAPGVVMPLSEFVTLPPYSGRQRGDSFRGYRVRITEAGFAAIGVDVPSREEALTWACSESEVDAALALLRQDAASAVRVAAQIGRLRGE